MSLIELEYKRLGSDYHEYADQLINLCSYLRYPTNEMPKQYRPLLLTMTDLPHLLREKLGETFHDPESSQD